MTKYYVYSHSNEEYGTFYVGKGSGERLYKTGNRSQFWKRIASKYGYEAKIIEETDSEEEAYKREIYWIAHFKNLGQCHANFSLGGDGVRVEKRWWGPKISESLKGIKRPSGLDNKAFLNFASADELHDLYVIQGLSIDLIGSKFGVSAQTVWSRLKFFGIPIRDIKSRGRRIICNETGEEFASITEAARKLCLFRENIRKVLSGKYKHSGGLTFKYKD